LGKWILISFKTKLADLSEWLDRNSCEEYGLSQSRLSEKIDQFSGFKMPDKKDK
jgi:hypothetical protein